MPTALICSNGGNHITELMSTLSNLSGWEIHSCNIPQDDVGSIQSQFVDLDIHFLIYTIPINSQSLQNLKSLRQTYPLTYIIYYNSHLIDQQFLKLSDLGVNSCIVGVERKRNLREYLLKLWEYHWKRIPEHIYPNAQETTSPRVRKVIKFLENKPVTECTTEKLSKYLNISQSHFRSEFKSQFGINFREFKQRLFNHYESELLLSNKYKPRDICKILNYKYIANYSRSFKSRHGDCWRNIQSN